MTAAQTLDPASLDAQDIRRIIDFSAKLPKWRAAKARVMTGLGPRAKLAFVGDSTFAGVGGQSGSSGAANSRPYSVPLRVAAILDALGIPTQTDGYWGDNNMSPVATYDTRLTLGAGWAPEAGLYSGIGGNLLLNSTTTNPISLVMAKSFDKVEVRYRAFAGGGQFTLNVDGGAAVTPDGGSNAYVDTTNATSMMKIATFTVSAGTHTINIARNGSGGAVRIISVEAYNSTAQKVSVANLGISGARTSTWQSIMGSFPYLWTGTDAWLPDLTVLDLGINDWLNSVTPDTFETNLTALVTAAKTNGDVLMVTPIPSSTSQKPIVDQDAIVDRITKVAAAQGCPLVDLYRKTGLQASASVFYYDGVHKNALGYNDDAVAIANLLMAA